MVRRVALMGGVREQFVIGLMGDTQMVKGQLTPTLIARIRSRTDHARAASGLSPAQAQAETLSRADGPRRRPAGTRPRPPRTPA